MKNLITLLILFLVSATAFAQNSLNYKAIITDNTGAVVANDLIQVQFTILQGVAQTNVYEESHTPTTDANGLIILNIGEGTVIAGDFTTIDWASDTHFLNVRINTGGGLVDLGVTEFNAVPYALSSGDNQWAIIGNQIENKNTGIVNIVTDLNVEGFINTQSGATINEFSTDGTLIDDSDSAIPTERAVKTYVDNATSNNVSSIDDLSDGKADSNGSSLFMGLDAGANDDGSDNNNVGIGYQALTNNTTGFSNTAIGKNAMSSNITGNSNTATGLDALGNNTGGYSNTATGLDALFNNTTGFSNVATGRSALSGNTTGVENTAIGRSALSDITTGSGNVALGYAAGANETGSNKLYIANTSTTTPLIYGDFSTSNLTINGDLGLNTNTMIGSADFTLRSRGSFFGGMYIDSPNTNGDGKPFYGYSLDGAVKAFHFFDAADNTWKLQMASGLQTVRVTETGNVSIIGDLEIGGNLIGGVSSINDLSDAKANTTSVYIGADAGVADIDGNRSNVGVGIAVLENNTTGFNNTAVGTNALSSNTVGNSNTAIGGSALLSNTEGSNNTAIGLAALSSKITGDFNTAIGRDALRLNTTGFGNVALGHFAGRNESGSNKLYIANSSTITPLIYGEFDTRALTLNGATTVRSFDNTAPDLILSGTSNTTTGDDGIISSNPDYLGSDIFIRSNDAVVIELDSDDNEIGQFEIKAGDGTEVFEVDESGNVRVNGSLVHSSDRRLKKDIETLPYGLAEILKLEPKAYHWKNRDQDFKSLGLIAQEVQPIINEIVVVQDDEAKTLGVSYTELIPVLINAIKEQQAQIESLETANNTKDVALAEILKRVEKLENEKFVTQKEAFKISSNK